MSAYTQSGHPIRHEGKSGRKKTLRPLSATSPPVPAVVMTPVPAVARVIGVGTVIVWPPPAPIGTTNPTHLLYVCISGRCDRRNRRRESCGSDNRTAQHGSAYHQFHIGHARSSQLYAALNVSYREKFPTKLGQLAKRPFRQPNILVI
jgi:hypothetical protein